MNEKLKKKLTSNWFKILQDSICDDIEKIEGKKNIFNSKFGKVLASIAIFGGKYDTHKYFRRGN